MGRVAESRFQRVAMSLGDGLICTDANYLVTVWNSGATAIFGYQPEQMIGRPFDAICAGDEAGTVLPFSIRNAAALAAGTVIEFSGRRSNGESFPVEASFSGWQGTDGSLSSSAQSSATSPCASGKLKKSAISQNMIY